MNNYDDKNVINGTYGEVWVNSDYMAESTGLEAKITLEKTEVNKCKRLAKGYKITGTDGKGTLKMNHVSSYFVTKYLDALSKGKTPDTSITTRLEDPDAFGAEEVKLEGVILDEVTLANWEAKKLGEESIPFTFSSATVIQSIPFK